VTLATSPKPTTSVNIHGRHNGGGVRPLLIAAKVVTVALYIGGLAAATFIWVGSGYNAIPQGDPRRAWLINLVGRMMVFFVVPMLILAMLLGVALLLRQPRQFLRMRWLRVKLALLLILIPAGHFWCRTQTLTLRNPDSPVTAQGMAARRLSFGLTGTLAGSIVVVVIGRLKPRLGQQRGAGF
jgi:hypothetical protein